MSRTNRAGLFATRKFLLLRISIAPTENTRTLHRRAGLRAILHASSACEQSIFSTEPPGPPPSLLACRECMKPEISSLLPTENCLFARTIVPTLLDVTS
jgi:hypothetical protein